MKTTGWVFVVSSVLFLFILVIQCATAAQFYWKDELKYSSLSQFQASGWTADTNPSGVSFDSKGMILDGTSTDTAVHYNNHFPSGLSDWKVEVRSMWLDRGHSGPDVFIYTSVHSYGWAADGYYKGFAFYRDSKKVMAFGSYSEQSGAWVTLKMAKEGNTISLYYNGKLMNTYTEEDSASSEAVGIGVVSPWRGNQEYGYFQFGDPASVFTSASTTESSSGFPVVPVAVGGSVAAVVVGGALVYYFVIAGGASEGAAAGAAAEETAQVVTGGVSGSTVSVAGGQVDPSTGSSLTGGAGAGAGVAPPPHVSNINQHSQLPQSMLNHISQQMQAPNNNPEINQPHLPQSMLNHITEQMQTSNVNQHSNLPQSMLNNISQQMQDPNNSSEINQPHLPQSMLNNIAQQMQTSPSNQNVGNQEAVVQASTEAAKSSNSILKTDGGKSNFDALKDSKTSKPVEKQSSESNSQSEIQSQ